MSSSSSSSSILVVEHNQTAATDYHNNVSLKSNSNSNVEEEVHDHQNIQNPEQEEEEAQRRQRRNHRHNDDDVSSRSSASSSSSSDKSLKKAQTTIKEMMYCFESFSMIFTPVSICMVLSALAVVFINTDETRQQTQQQFANTYEVITIDSTNSNSKNTLSSIGNALIIVSVVCVMTFVVALLYKYRCMKIFYGYMILVTTVLLGFLSSNMWIIAIEKYNWYRIDKFSFIFLIWNFTIVGILSIFWAPSVGIPKFVQQGYLIVSSIILAWQLSFFSNWTAWTLLVILALYDLFAVLSPCGPLKYLAKLMSKQNAPEIPGLLYEATLPNGIKKPKSKPKRTRNNNNNDDNDNDNETKEQEEDDNNNNPSTSSSSSSAPSAPSSSMQQQQQQSKSSSSSSNGGSSNNNKKEGNNSKSKPIGERSSTLKTLPPGSSSSQFIVVNNNNNDQSSSSSSSRVLIRSRSGGGENVVVEVSQQQQQQQQQDHDEDDERQHEQQQQQQEDHHPPPFFVSSNSSNNTGGNKDVEEDSPTITYSSSSRIPLSQLIPLSTAPAAASAAASANNELRVVIEEQTPPLPLNTGRIPLAIAKLYKLRVVDEEGALQPKQNNNKLLTWSRMMMTTRGGNRKSNNNDDDENDNHNNWQTHYTPDEINEIEWTPKQLQTVITGIFPQYGGRVEKSTDEEDQNKEDNEDGGPRYNVYNRNGDLLRKFVVNKDGQVMQVVKKERSSDDDDDSDENNSIKLGLGDFIFYSVLVSKAALHSFTAFSACMVVILFGLLATLVLLAMYGKALPALPISIFLGVITFLITRSLTEPWIQDVLRTPFYV